jgi:hypothetical protein
VEESSEKRGWKGVGVSGVIVAMKKFNHAWVKESWWVNYKQRLIEIRKTWRVGPSNRMALTCDADFEKEYEAIQKEGIEIEGPRSTLRKGDELSGSNWKPGYQERD